MLFVAVSFIVLSMASSLVFALPNNCGVTTSARRGIIGLQRRLSRFPMHLNDAMVELKSGDSEFKNEVLSASSTQPVLVDFMANWCGPCKLVGPIFKTLAEDFQGKVKFVKVDTDVHEDTVDAYNIQGLPLFALFIDGKIVAQHSGALTRDNLRAFVEKNSKVSA